MSTDLEKLYGNSFEPALLEEISAVGILKEFNEGDTIISPGSYINSMPLLLEGVIKILRDDEDGQEMLLYFLEIGDTCAMTLSCCMGQMQSEITAIAETDIKLLMIPVQKMEVWSSKYKSWRGFVFNSYHSRMMEMLETIDNIAFLKMDKRLLKYLKNKVEIIGQNTLNTTHQQIADDLHTSRVVISRLLKALENKNLVILERNQIRLIDNKT